MCRTLPLSFPAMKRRLRLTEGGSDKFWYIDVAEDHVTVRYGRSGTAGTTRTKQYDSADKALTEAKKQVSAKIKKGYTDDATASTEEPETTEATRPREKNETVAAERMVGEPADAPLEVSDLNADDLGLVLTPFERAYDINAEVSIEVDDSPFDPEAELERAERIVVFEPYSDGYARMLRVRFTEPLFDTMPSPERITWWVKYLKELQKIREEKYYANQKIHYRNSRETTLYWPTWLKVVLNTNWRAPLTTCAAELGKLVEGALILRPLLTMFSDADITAARAGLPSPLPAPFSARQYYNYAITDHSLFTAAGLDALDQDEARNLLEAVPKNQLQHNEFRNFALAGLVLPTPTERVTFARRTGARVVEWSGVVPWLAATGAEGFGLLLSWIDQQARETSQAMLTSAAEAGHGPGMAGLFLDALKTKAADVATHWLRSHLPQVLAADLTRSQANALAPLLREIPTEQIRGVAERTTGSTRAVIEEILAESTIPELPADTAWWTEASSSPKLPATQNLPFSTDGLPPILIDGQHRLGAGQVKELLRALSAAERHPLAMAVHDRADRLSRDRFALALVHLWLAAGAPAKLSWLMTGAGWLGDSEFVNTLTPLIREWPGVSQHQRAVKGLTALRNVASDEALQQISGIAAKVKFAGLKKRAGQAMDEIAAQRGFTRDELEDRVIPDGGLDERGTRIFDYGTRRFLAYVTPDGKLAARILDAEGHPAGKALSTLPTPNKSDNSEQAKAAKAEYNLVKKAVTTLAKVQLARFERAMIQDRRWAPEDHARFIAPHPVLRHLLAGIIWGLYDTENALTGTARVDEDGHLVDPDDEPMDTDGCSIGIVHPLELDDTTKAAWGEVLADYELAQPFKQLDRPTFRLPEDQGNDTKLHDLPKGTFPAAKLIGAFTKYGWERGEALDAGVYCIHALTIPTADLTAVICYTGMWMGPMTEQEDQEIEAAYILKGCHDPKNLGWGDEMDTKGLERVPWNQAPPTIVSEILATLETIRG